MFPQQARSSLSNSTAHDKTLDYDVMLDCGKKDPLGCSLKFYKVQVINIYPHYQSLGVISSEKSQNDC